MTRKSRRELERSVEGFESSMRGDAAADRELSAIEKYLVRMAIDNYEWSGQFVDEAASPLAVVKGGAKKILETAVEECDGDDITIADIDAAAARLGIQRRVEL